MNTIKTAILALVFAVTLVYVRALNDGLTPVVTFVPVYPVYFPGFGPGFGVAPGAGTQEDDGPGIFFLLIIIMLLFRSFTWNQATAAAGAQAAVNPLANVRLVNGCLGGVCSNRR